MFDLFRRRFRQLRKGEGGMETLQAVGLAFVGVLIILVLFVIYAAVRKNTGARVDELNKLDYNSTKPSPKSDAESLNLN